MNMVLGIAAGLLWGVPAALINMVITRGALKKNSANALMVSNLIRTAVDIAALGAVFLLRRFLPFSFEAMLLGTAISLSLLTVFFAFRMAGAEKGKKREKKEE